MKWTALPKGSFTEMHWAKPGATSGFVLIWSGQKPAGLPVMPITRQDGSRWWLSWRRAPVLPSSKLRHLQGGCMCLRLAPRLRRMSRQLSHKACCSSSWLCWLILFLLCFRVEVNLRDSAPIPGLSRPTIWVGITCRGINLSPRIKQRFIDLHVALRRRYKANRAVPMLVVVPVHQLCHPATRLQQAAKRFDGHLRTVLQRPDKALPSTGCRC